MSGMSGIVPKPASLSLPSQHLSAEKPGARRPLCQRAQLWADVNGRLFYDVWLLSDQLEGGPSECSYPIPTPGGGRGRVVFEIRVLHQNASGRGAGGAPAFCGLG